MGSQRQSSNSKEVKNDGEESKLREDEANAIMNAIISATEKAERQVKKQQNLSPKDLPTFCGQAHEDANNFIGQF